MERIRCQNQVFNRHTPWHSWVAQQFSSINKAKKANGIDSRTVEKQSQLPKQNADRRNKEQRASQRRLVEGVYQPERRKRGRRSNKNRRQMEA